MEFEKTIIDDMHINDIELSQPTIIREQSYLIHKEVDLNDFMKRIDNKIESVKADHNTKIDTLKLEHMDELADLLESQITILITEMIKHAFGTQFHLSKNKKKRNKEHQKKHENRINDEKFDTDINSFISLLSDEDKECFTKCTQEIVDDVDNDIVDTISDNIIDNFKILSFSMIKERNRDTAHVKSLKTLKDKLDRASRNFERHPVLKETIKDKWIFVKNRDAFLQIFFKNTKLKAN